MALRGLILTLLACSHSLPAAHGLRGVQRLNPVDPMLQAPPPGICNATINVTSKTPALDIQTLLSNWNASKNLIATICFDNGRYMLEKTITVPTYFQLTLYGVSAAQTVLDGSLAGTAFYLDAADSISLLYFSAQKAGLQFFTGQAGAFQSRYVNFAANAHVADLQLSAFMLKSCIVEANGYTEYGAFKIAADTISIQSSTFEGNIATGQNPGGIGAALYLTGPAPPQDSKSSSYEVQINSSTFEGNIGYGGGGAIYTTGVSMLIQDTSFLQNSGGSNVFAWGGAISFNQGQHLSIQDSKFIGNYDGCGAMALSVCSATFTVQVDLDNTLFLNNTSDQICTPFKPIASPFLYGSSGPVQVTSSNTTYTNNLCNGVVCPENMAPNPNC